MYYKTSYISPLGKMTLASDGENLIGLYFDGQKYFLSSIKSEIIENNGLEIFKKTKKWLDEYFKGKNPSGKGLKLKLEGSDFRKNVWQKLCSIPYGKTASYNDIAKSIAAEKGIKRVSCQAVGSAIGHNPISIIIPCHRVVGTNGNLTGYAAGVEIKKKLLELERVEIEE